MSGRKYVGRIAWMIAIGLCVLGVVIAGWAAYTTAQSTPYLVQVDEVATTSSESATAYHDLSSSQQAIFDRMTTDPAGPATGQAAHVEDTSLAFFANNAVRYRGEVYTFDIQYDPGSPGPLFVGFGVLVALVGGCSSLLLWYRGRRREATSDPFAA